MLLSDYIEQALVKHDCAIVPGLGGFVVQRESARILEDKVLPPHSTVGFNPLLTHTDGQLAADIMRNKEISYKEADALLCEWINEWQRALEAGNAVDMGKIGTLQRQPDGHIEFLPKDMYFLPDNLGLSPIFRHRKELTKPRKQPILLTYSRYVAACAAFALLLFAPGNTPTSNYVDYATQEIQQQKPERPTFVMIVEEDSNEKKYKDKNLGIFHEIRKSMWLSSKRR